MRGDHHTDVPRHRLQHDILSEWNEPRDAGRGWPGGAPVLAPGGDQVLPGSQVLPVQHVHAHLPGGVPQAPARLPECLRTSPLRMRAHYAAVQLRVAGEDGLRAPAHPRWPGQPLHGTAVLHGSGKWQQLGWIGRKWQWRQRWLQGQGQAGRQLWRLRIRRIELWNEQQVPRTQFKKLPKSPRRKGKRKRVQLLVPLPTHLPGEGAAHAAAVAVPNDASSPPLVHEPHCPKNRRRSKLRHTVQGSVLQQRRKGLRRPLDSSVVGFMLLQHPHDPNHIHHRHRKV